MSFKKMLLMTCALAASVNGESMKLVNKTTGKVMVEFNDHKATFYNSIIEEVIREEGIRIPPRMKDQFEGKSVIFIDDPLLQKAFVEVFWPFELKSMDTPYEWRN